jgi:hypothetical protein
MSIRPFRFVHASDFHLEQPAHGIAEIPEHLRESLIEAPYQAAQRVFDCVLAEDAEFLVLSGDLVDPLRSGPRAVLFLNDQFQRLFVRKIPVYWCGGEVDPPDAWPTWATLPENVHVFPRGRTAEFVHERDGVPLARLIGVSNDSRRAISGGTFIRDPAGLFSLGVVYGAAEAAALQSRDLDYWALGGKHARSTLFSTPHTAHWPGSPQGRCFGEPGAHGCTVVHVDANHQSKLVFLSTDVLRWANERVAIDDGASRHDLQTLLQERLQSLMDSAPGMSILVAWTIVGGGLLWRQLRRGGLPQQLLSELRGETGLGAPAAWSLTLAAEAAEDLPGDWYEQETILGDFLRSIRHWQINAGEPIDLSPYLDERHLAGTLGANVAIGDEQTRQRVLREATWLGVDLLTGEEPSS